jgi:hypothetical protein
MYDARHAQRLGRQVRRVGTHVGDDARSRTALRQSHRALGAPKPRRLERPCWSVLVMNGAGGLLVVRFFSIERTVNGGHAPTRRDSRVTFLAGPLASASSVVSSRSRT